MEEEVNVEVDRQLLPLFLLLRSLVMCLQCGKGDLMTMPD